ncbi:hypothetical protein J5N97_009718 [Dioscorea zingiberensis]|uniref:Uncharacterized protein n=1 Tax=Dioscorea zingiberensis TaxID=325984 RepID=A0A9D5CY25_9LILI|nr:hypothetical protein J5N97_009718 [Dioscorea zingiberensis]
MVGNGIEGIGGNVDAGIVGITNPGTVGFGREGKGGNWVAGIVGAAGVSRRCRAAWPELLSTAASKAKRNSLFEAISTRKLIIKEKLIGK